MGFSCRVTAYGRFSTYNWWAGDGRPTFNFLLKLFPPLLEIFRSNVTSPIPVSLWSLNLTGICGCQTFGHTLRKNWFKSLLFSLSCSKEWGHKYVPCVGIVSSFPDGEVLSTSKVHTPHRLSRSQVCWPPHLLSSLCSGPFCLPIILIHADIWHAVEFH